MDGPATAMVNLPFSALRAVVRQSCLSLALLWPLPSLQDRDRLSSRPSPSRLRRTALQHDGSASNHIAAQQTKLLATAFSAATTAAPWHLPWRAEVDLGRCNCSTAYGHAPGDQYGPNKTNSTNARPADAIARAISRSSAAVGPNWLFGKNIKYARTSIA
jgi:hypothetical protein